MSDPYVYVGTDILKNKSNITSEEKYQKMETMYSMWRIIELDMNPIKGNFDFDHLKSIHGYLYQDVWSWAGETRTVNIAKNDMFAVPQYIDSFASSIFKNLEKNNYLMGLDQDIFTVISVK